MIHLDPILAFWIAYVLTRPFGASFADWAGKRRSLSGLDVGTAKVSVILALLIAAPVGYLTVSRRDAGGGNVDS